MEGNVGLDSPPRSMETRKILKKKVRDSQHKKTFLTNLRKAFDEADVNQRGIITYTQWCNSSLRKIIHDGRDSMEEFELFFKKVDANSDHEISWSELVHYMVNEVNTNEMKKSNEAVNFIQKFKTVIPTKTQMHRDMVHTILISNRTSEYITISQESVRFWKQSNLQYNRCITEPVKYATGLIFDNIQLLAVATTSRRLFFYDLENFVKVPLEVNASPQSTTIKKMTRRQAISALSTMQSKHPPMYNLPTAMCISNSLNTKTIIFFVGDDSGVIEIYELQVPQRRAGTDYSCNRISRHSVHSMQITQISALGNMLDTYASSSVDGTVKFWSFNAIDGFKVTTVFNNEEPVMTFYYSSFQKTVACSCVGRDAYVWSASPPRKIFKLGGHYNAVAKLTGFTTTTGERYILTMTNKKEFWLWDALNFRLVKEWSDPSILRPENRYSTCVFDSRRKCLITASNCPSKWGEDFSVSEEAAEVNTHNRPIVGCFYVPEFGSVVTVDTILSIKTHSLDGAMTSCHMSTLASDDDVACACLDSSRRRLITNTFGNELKVWNYHSGVAVNEVPLDKPRSFTAAIIHATVNGRDFLIRAGWDRCVYAYTEIHKGEFELFRVFEGHTDDVECLLQWGDIIVSASVNGEVMAWSIDINSRTAYCDLRENIECMCGYKSLVFIGGSDGWLRVRQMPKLTPVAEFEPYRLSVPFSISAVCAVDGALFIGDTLGYVKKYIIDLEKTELTEASDLKRCSLDEITHIVSAPDVIMTVSADQCVRVWTRDLEYIGLFSDNSRFDLKEIQEDPFKIDPNHVYVPPKLSPTISQVRSMRQLMRLEVEKKKTQRDSPAASPQKSTFEAKPFDFMEAKTLFDEFFATEGRIEENRFDLSSDAAPPPPLKTKLPELKPVSREYELRSQVLGLQKKAAKLAGFDYGNDGRAKTNMNSPRGTRNMASEMMNRIKFPITTPASPFRRKLPKPTLSAPVYDF